MKNKLLIGLVFGVYLSVSGQNFPTDSAYWKERYYDIECLNLPFCYEYQYFLQGDTLIGNNTYNKIYKTFRYFNSTYYDFGYQGAIYYDDEADKVYWRQAAASKDTLLYDFNLSVGDTLPETFLYSSDMGLIIRIDSIDTIVNNNKSIVRYHMDNAGWGGAYILHGIGSTLGLLEPIFPFFESENHLSCFQNYTDSISYPGPDYQNCEIFTTVKDYPYSHGEVIVYPNPANGILNIDHASGSHVQIFSITGLLISESEIKTDHFELKLKDVPEGMYFLRFEKDFEIQAKKIIVQR